MMIQNYNAMDSAVRDIGTQIIEAGCTGNLAKLWAIRKMVGEINFQRTCDLYRDLPMGKNVLHHAAEIGHFEICKFLIMDVAVHVDALTYNRSSPLMLAVKEEREKIVNYLIYQGADITVADCKGYTAFHYAVLRDNLLVMNLLLRRGAYIDADSVDGTSLQMAVSRRKFLTVKFLLCHGAHPNSCGLRLENALVCAIKSHSFACMDELLKAMADTNIYVKGYSPLSYAAMEDDTRYLKRLLRAGADPNSSLTGVMKPIEYAALADNREAVELLFPLSRPLEGYGTWSVDGIMELCHTEAAQKLREKRRQDCLVELEKRSREAVARNDFRFAAASAVDPSNPKWASRRSLCHAHAGARPLAMHDLKESLALHTRHQSSDAAHQILTKFLLAGLAFALDPHSREAAHAFSVALFDQCASLFLKASPQEILKFTQS